MENKDFRGKGLLARFLYSIPNTRVGERVYKTKPVSPFVRSDYEKLIHELLDIPDFTNFSDRIIKLSDEADKLAEEYYHWIESRLTNELEEIEDWAGKLHGNTMRIAGVAGKFLGNRQALIALSEVAKGTNKTTLTERVFNTEVEAERLQERLIELDVNFPKSILMIPTFKDDLLKIARMCGEELTNAEKDLGADYQDIVNMQMRAAMGLGE